jgi:hypothetical protein
MKLDSLALIKPGTARSDYSIPADDSREISREGVGEELVVNGVVAVGGPRKRLHQRPGRHVVASCLGCRGDRGPGPVACG